MAAAVAISSTVKYGIIGVGMMGREHLINLHHLRTEGVAVVAIADPHVPSQDLALQLAQSFNWPLKVFSGHRELLDSGLCDVLVVSSPNMTHYEILMDIINHPKPHHVLVEKPLCTTVAHCKEVVNAARKRQDILVQVGLEYRYMPPVAKLIEIVKGGNLGQVKMVAIREHRFPFLVKVNNWNRFNVNSGGTLVEKCCHFFDLMRLFAGANPVRVMASGAIDVNHKDEIYDGKVPDIIDNAYVIVEFDNGSRGMLDLCMFAEGSKNEQEISVVGHIGKGNACVFPFSLIKITSMLQGEAFVPESIVRFGTREKGRDGVHTLKAEDDRIKYDGLHHGSSYLEHLNFLSAVRAKGGQAPAVGLQDGLISVAIGVAAQFSIEKGRFVPIAEVMD
ncbi:myo-inositol 2-dehydrogenase [Quercus suber]|uniref:Myo-inositol 2-dehydrogenase n=1 Tax=Quercus suber TaxID=58331 RepID=A0AAW0JJH6_QUESU